MALHTFAIGMTMCIVTVTGKLALPSQSASCKSLANPGCASLSGDCCPARDGMMLACCSKPSPNPPAPTPAPAPPPTPVVPTPGRRTAKEAAALLNTRYMGFDVNNDNSALGVTISMLGKPRDLNQNLFCSPLMGTQCFKGEADCRMSASLYNHKIVLEADVPNRIKLALDRPVGIVIDQTNVETRFGKCAYVFDGASFSGYNSGCGDIAAAQDCASLNSAFHNICPSTGQICTADDVEVHRKMCKPEGPVAIPNKGTDQQCYFGLPALDWPRTGKASHLREMAKARAARQVGSDALGPLIEQWNEVIVDEHMMIQDLRNDATSVITAFIYKKSQSYGKALAIGLRQKFSQEYNVDVNLIPIVGVDDTADFTTTGGPFFADDRESGTFISIV
jgi:hypothetical protein